jgi:ATP-dependent Lon protease
LGANNQAREATRVAIEYFKANAKHISNNISVKEKDYHIAVQDLQGIGMADDTTLPVYIAMCSIAMNTHIQDQLAIL